MPAGQNDDLVRSSDPDHPANLIPELCKKFYQLGWVTGESLKVVFIVSNQVRYWRRSFDQTGKTYLHCALWRAERAYQA